MGYQVEQVETEVVQPKNDLRYLHDGSSWTRMWSVVRYATNTRWELKCFKAWEEIAHDHE